MVREEALLWFKQGEHDLRKAYNDLITQDWDSAAFGLNKLLRRC